MTKQVKRKVNFFSAKLLLAAAGIMAVALPLIVGLVNAPQSHAQAMPVTRAQLQVSPSLSTSATPIFEIASIKPDKSRPPGGGIRFSEDGATVINVSLKVLISDIYGVREDLIMGAPGWVDSAYDVDAKFDDSVTQQLSKLPPIQRNTQIRSALQSLLANRCKLKVSRSTKELPIYALVIAKGGLKIKQTTPGDMFSETKSPDGLPGKGIVRMRPGKLTAQAVPIASLAHALSERLNRSVVDKTGLRGKYDVTMQWAPDSTRVPIFSGAGSAPSSARPPDSSGPSLFTALQEQLGLKLVPQKGPVEVLVIDHIERPSPN